MSLNNFSTRQKTGIILLLLIIVLVFLGFKNINKKSYEETQDSENMPQILGFDWRFEEAKINNLDGKPKINVFLDIKYSDGEVKGELIGTTDGGCNELPEPDPDSMTNTSVVQCYYAGFGELFKIVKGEESYLIKNKSFEEALPNQNPPINEYKTIREFPLM